eukprot:7338262-Prymnesium_polylepis.1
MEHCATRAQERHSWVARAHTMTRIMVACACTRVRADASASALWSASLSGCATGRGRRVCVCGHGAHHLSEDHVRVGARLRDADDAERLDALRGRALADRADCISQPQQLLVRVVGRRARVVLAVLEPERYAELLLVHLLLQPHGERERLGVL